jgi:hypothetical protein
MFPKLGPQLYALPKQPSFIVKCSKPLPHSQQVRSHHFWTKSTHARFFMRIMFVKDIIVVID